MKAPSVCTGVGIANSNVLASVEHPQETDSEVEPGSEFCSDITEMTWFNLSQRSIV